MDAGGARAPVSVGVVGAGHVDSDVGGLDSLPRWHRGLGKSCWHGSRCRPRVAVCGDGQAMAAREQVLALGGELLRGGLLDELGGEARSRRHQHAADALLPPARHFHPGPHNEQRHSVVGGDRKHCSHWACFFVRNEQLV